MWLARRVTISMPTRFANRLTFSAKLLITPTTFALLAIWASRLSMDRALCRTQPALLTPTADHSTKTMYALTALMVTTSITIKFAPKSIPTAKSSITPVYSAHNATMASNFLQETVWLLTPRSQSWLHVLNGWTTSA